MYSKPMRQLGGSTIVNLILLAALGYGIFVGIQYAPQWVESHAIESILYDIKNTRHSDPVRTESAVRDKVVRMLQINDLGDMTDSFEIRGSDGNFEITFSYDRELNLGFEVRTIHYKHSISL